VSGFVSLFLTKTLLRRKSLPVEQITAELPIAGESAKPQEQHKYQRVCRASRLSAGIALQRLFVLTLHFLFA
jgi:hypothetical protein